MLGVALLLLGVGLLNTIVALRSSMEGYSEATLGVIMSSYFVGFFIGTYLALPLIRRVGHIRAFACCASVVSVCVLLHQIIIDAYAWMLIRVVTGISLVILYTIIESWLNGQTPAEQRGKVFALYMTVNLGAMAVAQQFLLFDPNITFLLFALTSVLVSLSLVPVTWTKMQQPVVSEVKRLRIAQLMTAAPVAVVAAVVSGLMMGAFWGLAAAYAAKIGMSNSQVAYFVACAIVGGAVLQFPLGRLSDRQDRRLVLMLISAVATGLSLLLALMGNAGWLLFLVVAGYGGMAFAVYPVAVAHLVDHLAPEDMLSGGSRVLLLHGVGAMLGPLLAGQLMQWLGASTLALFWSLGHAALALFAWWHLHTGSAENPDEHTADFVPMVRTTPTALEMLPADEQSELFEGHAPVWGSEIEADENGPTTEPTVSDASINEALVGETEASTIDEQQNTVANSDQNPNKP